MRIFVIIAENINDGKPTRDEEARNAFRRDLLRKGLQVSGFSGEDSFFSLEQLSVSAYGKPFFQEHPEIHFNISHSGKYIACAFSDEEIGLDLQECVSPHMSVLRLSNRFFTAEEDSAIRSFSGQETLQQNLLFFRLWSVKEAYLKYIGCGLQGELNSFLPEPFPDRIPPPLPLHAAETVIAELKTLRGTIHVLKKEGLLSPAEYSLLPAPAGFTMAVSALSLPESVSIQYI